MSVSAHRILNVIRDADHVLNDPGAGGRIEVSGDLQICELVTLAAESRMLDDPTKAGIRLTIRMKTDGGDCTVTAANGLNADGDTQAVFANVGDQLELISVSHATGFRWEILVNTGPAALLGGAASASIPFFISMGESNSGGLAPNALPSAGELAARSVLKIWNNTSSAFQDLDVGTNNLISHAGLTDNASHGIEIGLANTVEGGRFSGVSTGYLLKSGQGGSAISQWNTGGSYQNTFESRYASAVAALASGGVTGYTPYVFYTLGLNDCLGGTAVATWKAAVIAHHARLRTIIGASTKIYITKFSSPPFLVAGDLAGFNAAIQEIADASDYTEALGATDLSVREGVNDTSHLGYYGYLEIAERMVDLITATTQADDPTFSDASGIVSSGTVITVTPPSGATVRVTTSNELPTSHSSSGGTATITAPTIVRGRSFKPGLKNSNGLFRGYDVATPSAWSTSVKAPGATLSGSDKIATNNGADNYYTVRGTVGKSSGAYYYEIEMLVVPASAFMFLGVMDGTATSLANGDYLGSFANSAGVTFGGNGFANGSGYAATTTRVPVSGVTAGDIFQFAIDLANGLAWVGRNGVWSNRSENFLPWIGGDNFNKAFTFTAGHTIYPCMTLFKSTGSVKLLSGASELVYPPPIGFSPWG